MKTTEQENKRNNHIQNRDNLLNRVKLCYNELKKAHLDTRNLNPKFTWK